VNLLDISITAGCSDEVFEDLAVIAGVRIERIVSTGQSTPWGSWYDQDHDEWVAVLQGEGVVAFEDGSLVRLGAGDTLLLPAHRKHRVAATSANPPCIWIAVHGPAALG
jgi:cupin 2 domain-containing protein